LPYDAVVVAPDRVYAESFDVDPENIALQLHYGCLEADLMMQEDFHMASMKEKCLARFPLPTTKAAQSKNQQLRAQLHNIPRSPPRHRVQPRDQALQATSGDLAKRSVTGDALIQTPCRTNPETQSCSNDIEWHSVSI